MHPEVRSMSEALGLSLRHSDDDLSCSGPTRAWNINKPAHQSPRQQRMRVAVKPSSLKSEVGIRARTPTPVTALWKRVTEVTALWRRVTGSDEGEYAVEGGEEYFDESEHVDGFVAEERSTDGEEVDESEGEDGRGPEGSDFAAEEGYEEGGPDAEEGYEEVWDEVQEALSTMGHEEFDETADLCARSQASRPSSAASSQASVRSRMCLVYLYLFISCVQLRLSSEDFQW